MSTSISLNGVSYTIPAVGEGSWGTNVSNYLVALSTGTLSKAGGSFTLTADIDFGASFGLKATYYKSRATVSTAGIMRLGNTESIGWRNAANDGNKLLKVNASNQLEYDGTTITPFAALTASRALVSDGSGIPSVSATTATELEYVSGVTSAIQTQLNGKQASGSYVTSGGALGTPSTGTLTNCTSYPNVTQSVAGLVASAGQLLGTNTNDDAAAGKVGELLGPISRIRSNGLSLTTATAANIGTTTSITLTAGDWDIRGRVSFDTTNSTVLLYTSASISKTSATESALDTISVPTSGEVRAVQFIGRTSAGAEQYTLEIPSYRYSVSTNTVIYLVASASFTNGSGVTAYGSLEARRIR